jgi:hypothetical protein
VKKDKIFSCVFYQLVKITMNYIRQWHRPTYILTHLPSYKPTHLPVLYFSPTILHPYPHTYIPLTSHLPSYNFIHLLPTSHLPSYNLTSYLLLSTNHPITLSTYLLFPTYHLTTLPCTSYSPFTIL